MRCVNGELREGCPTCGRAVESVTLALQVYPVESVAPMVTFRVEPCGHEVVSGNPTVPVPTEWPGF